MITCQIRGCPQSAPKESVIHVLYQGATHHFRICKVHRKLLLTHEGRWRIWSIKDRYLDVKLDVPPAVQAHSLK